MESTFIRVYRVKKHIFSYVIIGILLLSFLIITCTSLQANTYTPAPPIGPDTGFLHISYQFTIYTTSYTDEWMFDWGDGSTSTWRSRQISEDAIVESHRWGTIGEYQVKVKFRNSYFLDGVWSPEHIIRITSIDVADIPNIPSIPIGVKRGTESIEYSFSTSAKDTQNDDVQYCFDFGDQTITEWTVLYPSGSTISQGHLWTTTGEYNIKAQTRDHHGLTSDWSETFTIYIASDSDHDTIPDVVETEFGSNPSDPTDVTSVQINEIEYYFLSLSDGNIVCYNPVLDITNSVIVQEDTSLLMDLDNDGTHDYVYNPSLGSTLPYESVSESISISIPWTILAIIGIICGIILAVIILFKTGIIYFYEEEYGIEE